jgi:hypothetical protein
MIENTFHFKKVVLGYILDILSSIISAASGTNTGAEKNY